MKFIVKETRENKGMSQETLAYLAGISRATLSAIENNTANSCNINTLERIAGALKVPVSHLFLSEKSNKIDRKRKAEQT